MISLDALKESMTGEENTLVLDADSPIAKLFYHNLIIQFIRKGVKYSEASLWKLIPTIVLYDT
jgi:DNA helicase IV